MIEGEEEDVRRYLGGDLAQAVRIDRTVENVRIAINHADPADEEV